MSAFFEYREVWVAEDKDGRPLRSAIDPRRLSDKEDVFRYVPADLAYSALEYLERGNKAAALRILRGIKEAQR